MANKKKKTKKSNSYWMKYGGDPRKMHKGGFAHPEPHPKNATDAELRGAQIWSTAYTEDNEGNKKNLEKRNTYNWGDDKQSDVNAFTNSQWFNFFPDTLKSAPQTIQDLQEYEDAIGANRTRTIQLNDTDFSWDDAILYGGAPLAGWLGASQIPQSVPTPWTQGLGLLMKGLGVGIAGGKMYYDMSVKRGENERLKLENPYATFVDSDGRILNYEDGDGLFFNVFHPNNKSWPVTNRGIRDTPVPLEDVTTPDKQITFAMGGNPYRKRYEGGGNPYHVSSQKNITEDPTFKMWFAKNATRSDVMQSNSDPQALKQLFLNDINFAGNEMPLFSGEIDGYGNVDKSNRSAELSSKIIGGMKKFGGHGHSYKTSRIPKAELGMGTGLYESPSENFSDYSNVNQLGLDGRNANANQLIGSAGEDGTFSNYVLKAFNYVIPGLGTGLDIVADIFGHAGNVQQHEDMVSDAHEAEANLRLLNNPEANKETLDLSTRKSGLTAIASYNKSGIERPTYDWGELASNVLDIAGNYVGGTPKVGDATDSPIDFNNIGADDLLNTGDDLLVRYGGNPKKMNHGGVPHDEGANAFQPGTGIDIIGHQFNPLGQSAMFESQGTAGNSFNTGGDPNAEIYEAEGGEAIIHPPGAIPPTSDGDTTQVDGNPNEAMVSMLNGPSHEKGGINVQSEDGQYVFSKSLNSKTWGMSYADAAEKIGKNIAKFKTEMEEGDEITKSTAASMIEAWTQKLNDLQSEQETTRQTKFMELLNSGAAPEELQEKYPDIFQQYMQQQQQEQLSEVAMQSIAGPQGGMQDNPMGNIDMSQLSTQDQQLVTAKYGGTPKAENGFDPYDFNRYFGEIFDNNDFESFDLNKKYQPNRGDVMDWLTANYPDGGFEIGDETFMNNKDAYKALMSGFGDWRSGELSDLNVPGSKPNKYNEPYMVETTTKNPWYVEGGTEDEFITGMDWADGGKELFQQDKNLWNYYNMGLGVDWDENFGMDANLSKKQYFKALEARLLSEGKDVQDIKSIIEREKIAYDENLVNLENIENNKPLTDKEKADALAKQLRNQELMKKFGNFANNALTDLKTLAPSIYNMKKSKEGAEIEPFVSNTNELRIDRNLDRLTNSFDIQSMLDENEMNFNNLKYLMRDVSDGNSGNAMNALLRGQLSQNEADRKAFLTEAQLETQGLQIQNESLFNLGERNRQEQVRVNEANAMNRAAQEAFEAKGWEGLSGYSQLKDQMANQMSNDKQLAQMLNMIYPDAHLYMNRNGTMDINKLMQSGDLDKLMEQYPQLKEYIGNYFKNNTDNENEE